MSKIILSCAEVHVLLEAMEKRLYNRLGKNHNAGRLIYGVPRGGIPVAHGLAKRLDGSVTYDPSVLHTCCRRHY